MKKKTYNLTLIVYRKSNLGYERTNYIIVMLVQTVVLDQAVKSKIKAIFFSETEHYCADDVKWKMNELYILY